MSIGIGLWIQAEILMQGLKVLIEEKPDWELVSESVATEPGQVAIKGAKILVVFLGRCENIWREKLSNLQKLHSAPMVLLISGPSGDYTYHELKNFGVHGVLLFNATEKMLTLCVESVLYGNEFYQQDTAIRRTLLNSERTGLAELTSREAEVLRYLAEGSSVKEIALDLNLSVKTVEAHKNNLMHKLDIHNRAELVRYAIQKGIITIPNVVSIRATGTE